MDTIRNNLYYGLTDGWVKWRKNHAEWFCHDFFTSSKRLKVALILTNYGDTQSGCKNHLVASKQGYHENCIIDFEVVSVNEDGEITLI